MQLGGLYRLLPTSRAVRRTDQSVKAANTAVYFPTWLGGQPTYTQYKYEALVREGYLKCELIFSCMNARAKSTSSVKLKVYDSRTHEELRDHPLRKLLARPNPYMSENDFWKLAIKNLDLSGLAPFQKVRSNSKEVVQLWPLRPDYVKINRSTTRALDGYTWEPPGLVGKRDFAPEDVLLFIERDPRDFLTPVSRVQVAGRIVDVDNAVTDYIKLYWEKGGVPPGVLTSKNKLTPEQISGARARWIQRYGGYHQWDSPIILDDETTYQHIGNTFKDMVFDQLDGRSEVRICTVMDVPPIIVGTTIGLTRNTFSNYQEARKAWWEDMLIPLYLQLADFIQYDLVPEYETNPDDIYVAWDVSKVPALREDQAAKWDRAVKAITAGFVTVNDARHEAGLAKDLKGGDVYLRSNMITAVPQIGSGALEDIDPNAEYNVPGAGGEDISANVIRTPVKDRVKIKEIVQARSPLSLAATIEDVAPVTDQDVANARDYLKRVGVTFTR